MMFPSRGLDPRVHILAVVVVADKAWVAGSSPAKGL